MSFHYRKIEKIKDKLIQLHIVTFFSYNQEITNSMFLINKSGYGKFQYNE